jgi:hypothetical protein
VTTKSRQGVEPSSSRPRFTRDYQGEQFVLRAADFHIADAGHLKPVEEDFRLALGQIIYPGVIDLIDRD